MAGLNAGLLAVLGSKTLCQKNGPASAVCKDGLNAKELLHQIVVACFPNSFVYVVN